MSSKNVSAMEASRDYYLERAKEDLDPEEYSRNTSAAASIHFLTNPDPLKDLDLRHKLLILANAYKNLPERLRKTLGTKEFEIPRKLESGDYGITIKDKIPLENGWSLIVEADGGGGSIEVTGDELDDHPIRFQLVHLVDYLEQSDYEVDDSSWFEEVRECNATISDQEIAVSPGEAMDGPGKPTVWLQTPNGEIIKPDILSLEGHSDQGNANYRAHIEINWNNRPFKFDTEIALYELNSSCLGYNLDWSVDEQGLEGFKKKVDELLEESLQLLRRELH